MPLPANFTPAIASREDASHVCRDLETRLLELGLKSWVAYDHVGLAFLISNDRHGLRSMDASEVGWPAGGRPVSVDGWVEGLMAYYPNHWAQLR